MTAILHITPHLGGGIGKALSGLVLQTKRTTSNVQHQIVCLETPIKTQFFDQIRGSGGEIIVSPDRNTLNALVASSDIVQLEWWNHPATIKCLCTLESLPLRLLVWSHVSGLHNPSIPLRLIESAHCFLLTSPCSLESPQIADLAQRLGDRLAVISSGGGFTGLPEPDTDDHAPLSAGYIGSLNFAKLHPEYVTYAAAVKLPDFKVRMIGDPLNHDALKRQCIAAGRPNLLEFRGYTRDIAAELGSINVLAYLLNPRHYGTAENALLEAMAMGIPPVLLNNPCELCIVEHEQTGVIVHSPEDFANAIEWLAHNPAERSRMGKQAADLVRSRYTLEAMANAFHAKYRQISLEAKRAIDFTEIFGSTPDQWFLSCQENPNYFKEGGQIQLPPNTQPPFDLLETTKGSVFHFYDHFPQNANLAGWSNELKNAQAVQSHS